MQFTVRFKSLVLLLCAMAACSVSIVSAVPHDMTPQDNSHAMNPVKAGYVVVTPTSQATAGLVAFATFGERHGNQITQAGVLPSAMSTSAILFVSTNGRLSKNLGVAIANPNATTADVTLALRDDTGAIVATMPVQVAAHAQMAKFVTDLFSSQSAVPRDFTGTVDITSTIPVAIIGLRFRGNNFSTLPVTNLSALSPVPVISTGIGGPGAVILPQFASGGGWATEIVLVNTGTSALTVRVDLFGQDGNPLVANLNGVSASSFTNITIPAGGVFVLDPGDMDGDW